MSDIKTLTRELEQLRGRNAMLTDLVVSAAALLNGQVAGGSERDYLSEVLHTTALELVAENPRLAGAYTA